MERRRSRTLILWGFAQWVNSSLTREDVVIKANAVTSTWAARLTKVESAGVRFEWSNRQPPVVNVRIVPCECLTSQISR